MAIVLAEAPDTRRTDATTNVTSELTLSYVGLVLFTIGYYNRPEDWFPGGRFLPFALVGGILTLVGFFAYLIMGGKVKRSRDSSVVLMLLVWFIITIPFSLWKGGSFQIVRDNVAKIMMTTIVAMHALNTVSRLRTLLTIQVISIAIMGWVAHSHFDNTGRATGMGSAFGNSNDLAVVISITIPFLFAFMVEAPGTLKKLMYLAVMALMLFTLVMTYSRTGFLSIFAASAVCAWHFGVKRGYMGRVLIGTAILFAVFLAFAPANYGQLIKSIYSSNVDVGGVRADAEGSKEERQRLLERGIRVSLEHPLFGIGPNAFEQISGSWHTSHNTYIQLSSEAGIPALILFLVLVRYTFINLRDAELLLKNQRGSLLWFLVGSVRASFSAFLVGAFFTSFAYTFFPFFIIAYAGAIHQIAITQANSSIETTSAVAQAGA